MLLILGGELSVMMPFADGTLRRLATVSPGMVLGALSLYSGSAPEELVRADTDVECAVLGIDDLATLRERDPATLAALLEGLLRSVGMRAQRRRAELLHQAE